MSCSNGTDPSRTSSTRVRRHGGGFLPLSVKGDSANEVRDFQPAPTHLLEVHEGYVPYRTDAVYSRSLHPMGNCLLEAMTTAAGMGVGALGVNRGALDKYMDTWRVDPTHGPSMGVLDRVLCATGSPFRLPVVKAIGADLKWTRLFNMTEGIYLALVYAKDDDKPVGHFIVYDAWRDLLFMGPKWGVLRVQPEDKVNEEVARAYLFEHYQIKTPLRVCKLVVSAKRVSETKFNTKEHYSDLEKKREKKRAAKEQKRAVKKQRMSSEGMMVEDLGAD